MQGYQQPSVQPSIQGAGNLPFNYQSYVQPGFGPYVQPSMGQYPGMMVWDPSQYQQPLQPNVQLSYQTGQPIVSGSTQQPAQSAIQTPALSSVQQAGPSTPQTPPRTAATAATSVQSSTPVSGVSVVPSSTTPVSVQIPQVSVPQSGPSVQIPIGQTGISTVVTSQPQFTYQPYQGQPQFGPYVQNPSYQYQLYPGYTYQQPQYGLVHPGFPGGYTIPNANPIPSYPGYPPPGSALASQGFRDPNRQLPFIATLDLPDLTRLTNDPIFYYQN